MHKYKIKLITFCSCKLFEIILEKMTIFNICSPRNYKPGCSFSHAIVKNVGSSDSVHNVHVFQREMGGVKNGGWKCVSEIME